MLSLSGRATGEVSSWVPVVYFGPLYTSWDTGILLGDLWVSGADIILLCLFWASRDPLLGQSQHQRAVLSALADGASATGLFISVGRACQAGLFFGMGWLLWVMVCLPCCKL